MKAIFYIFAFLVAFIISPFFRPALAVSVSITSFPATISDQPISISASVSGATEGMNYLRIDFFKENTSNYFGETFNGSNWYSGSDGLLYFPVNIDNSKNGNATFQVKIGKPNNNDYPGPGSYKMRVRRYTASGNPASSDDQVPVDIQISYVSPTLSPTPSPVPTSTNTPTPSPVPTATKTPTPTKTLSPTKSPTPTKNLLQRVPTLTQKTTAIASKNTDTSNTRESLQSILGASDQISPSGSQVVSETQPLVKGNLLGLIFVGLGLVFLILCGIVIFWANKNKDSQEIFKNEI